MGIVCLRPQAVRRNATPGENWGQADSRFELPRQLRAREVADERRRLVECLLAYRMQETFQVQGQVRPSRGGLMAIPKFALDILVCPVCKTRVELLADESGLKCVSCRRVYPIRDEIPVMLPEEATIAEESPSR